MPRHRLHLFALRVFLPAGIVWFGMCGGCVRGCGGRTVRLDSLVTDGERLMLVKHLPPGIDEQEVRERLPSLGPVDPRTGTASQGFTVLGLPVRLEVAFREGVLQGCGYRLTASDSVAASILYRQLQVFYTAELGNYHEEFADADRPATSFWSSREYGLLLTLSRESAGFLLVWRFAGLPPPPLDTGPPV